MSGVIISYRGIIAFLHVIQVWYSDFFLFIPVRGSWGLECGVEELGAKRGVLRLIIIINTTTQLGEGRKKVNEIYFHHPAIPIISQ